MNINLGDPNMTDYGGDPPHVEIEEHIEIMRNAGVQVADQPVMLLSDAEYPGAYRVWLRFLPDEGTIEGADQVKWAWVNPEGEIIVTQWPWVAV